MEQPKYRFEDLHLQSDKDYTDINDTVVGFLIDKDVIVPFNIQRTLEDIMSWNMLVMKQLIIENIVIMDIQMRYRSCYRW